MGTHKKSLNGKYKLLIAILVFSGILFTAAMLLKGVDMAVLSPKGVIAEKERDLIIIATLLCMIVVVPVFVMLFWFAWKYRASNTRARYEPNWDRNRLLETIWWGVPCLIIIALGTITWKATHELDPYKSLDSNVAPIKVQVVALEWKWLFIYPDQHIATVNYLQIPVNTPVNFQITADAPMNSFWIPSLGGQVYAMSGMSTQLHLMASETGDYKGSSANISGEGFSGMNFTVKATPRTDFDNWVKAAQKSSNVLGVSEYDTLAEKSKDNPPAAYILTKADLYDTIVMKYMAPVTDSDTNTMKDMPGMTDMEMKH
ncbi:MAG TPA: ubiquinol oxidase subunit II [Candidatus Saccharimonadales bacterium]|nr:ubiquinol oxidase subunit II [Candidatus Saccharimonadales bacterium]